MDSPSSLPLQLDPVAAGTLTETVVTAIADLTHAEQLTPLYESVDPDALEALYEHGSPTVSFTHAGFHVTVHPDHSVTITDPPTE